MEQCVFDDNEAHGAGEAEDELEEVLSQHSGQQSSFRSSRSRHSSQEVEIEEDEDNPVKWSESVEDLLASAKGIELFSQFVSENGWKDVFQFYLAIERMKSTENVRASIPYQIYKRWFQPVRLFPIELSNSTRMAISTVFDALKKPDDPVSLDVFDEAQREALEAKYGLRDMHLDFIKSEKCTLYIDAVNEYNKFLQPDETNDTPRESDEENAPEDPLPVSQSHPPPLPPTYKPDIPWKPLASFGNGSSQIPRDDSGVFATTPQTPQHQLQSSQQHASFSQRNTNQHPTSTFNRLTTDHQPRSNSRFLPTGGKPPATNTTHANSNNARFPNRPSIPWFNSRSNNGAPSFATAPLASIISEGHREADAKTINPYHGRPFATFLPPTAYNTDRDSHVSMCSVGPRHLGQRVNPDEINFNMAKSMALRGNDRSIALPKPPMELHRGNTHKQSVQLDLHELRQKLASIPTKDGVAIAPARPDPFDETENILNAKCDQIWDANKTPESNDSPGGGSPIPPRAPGNFLGNISSGLTGLRLNGPAHQPPRFLDNAAYPVRYDNGQRMSNSNSFPAPTSSFFGNGARLNNGYSQNGQSSLQQSHVPRLASQMPPISRGGDSARHAEETIVPHPYQNIPGVSADSGISSLIPRTTQRVPPTSSSSRRTAPVSNLSHDSQAHSSRHQTDYSHASTRANTSRTTAPTSTSNRARLDVRRPGRQPQSAPDDSKTTVLYRFGISSGEFFMTSLTGTANLRNFKQHVLSEEQRRRGHKFFFRKEVKDCGLVLLELSGDDDLLPLHGNRVTACICET